MPLLIGLAMLLGARGLLARRVARPVIRPERARSAVRVAGVAAGAALAVAAVRVLSVRLLGGRLALPAVAPRTVLLLGLLVALVVLLAPAPAPPPAGAAERAAVAALVEDPGADTLAPFALRTDRSYAVSPDGRAAVAYRVLFGVAVAGGDPVGAPASAPAAVAEFMACCARSGWRVAVLGASDPARELWRRHGLRAVGIGDEAVLDPGTFDLTGRRMRNVRQAVARTHNAGVTTRLWRQADLPEPVRAELAAVVAGWPGHERGFSMNLDGLTSGAAGTGPDRADCVLAIARDEAGRVAGFQRYARCAGGSVLTLDAMPRLPGAPNGVNERLIVDTLAYAREAGVRRVSLNFGAFRALLEARHRTGRERLGYRVVRLLDPLIKVEPLYRFNAKFAPSWQPRSVMVPSLAVIGRVLVAALGMEFALPYDRRHASRRDVRPAGEPALPAGLRPGEQVASG